MWLPSSDPQAVNVLILIFGFFIYSNISTRISTYKWLHGYFKLLCQFACMCTYVCPPSKLFITSGVIYHHNRLHMIGLNKFFSFYMAVVVSIVSRHGLSIDEHHRNQPNKSMLVQYMPILSWLKQSYVSNKTECFYYKGRCCICGSKHFEAFK